MWFLLCKLPRQGMRHSRSTKPFERIPILVPHIFIFKIFSIFEGYLPFKVNVCRKIPNVSKQELAKGVGNCFYFKRRRPSTRPRANSVHGSVLSFGMFLGLKNFTTKRAVSHVTTHYNDLAVLFLFCRQQARDGGSMCSGRGTERELRSAVPWFALCAFVVTNVMKLGDIFCIIFDVLSRICIMLLHSPIFLKKFSSDCLSSIHRIRRIRRRFFFLRL